MIIVSQDDLNFVNFDNIAGISIETKQEWRKKTDREEGLTNVYIVKARINKDFSCVLGVYDKESRAKEVLRKIVQCYKDTNYEYENCWCLRNLVYEMPKE